MGQPNFLSLFGQESTAYDGKLRNLWDVAGDDLGLCWGLRGLKGQGGPSSGQG